jgi:hypothetical protein
VGRVYLARWKVRGERVSTVSEYGMFQISGIFNWMLAWMSTWQRRIFSEIIGALRAKMVAAISHAESAGMPEYKIQYADVDASYKSR